MELFDKVYGCYYHIMDHMLEAAGRGRLTQREMEEICRAYGFQESPLAILPRIKDGTWNLFNSTQEHEYSSRLLAGPAKLPLTRLQKAWLRSLLSDPRLPLFLSDEELEETARWMEDTDPLFDSGDFYYYDRYLDGDSYDSPEYRANFRTILTALREHRALFVAYEGKKGRRLTHEVVPYQLQYSSKDDKFRLCCLKSFHGKFCQDTLLNLGRLHDCHLSQSPVPEHLEKFRFQPVQKAAEPVLMEINGERNSLERCMLHFANYEKHTEYDEERGAWVCSIYYDMADETELLIDILSFGPVVRVLGPESFLRQIKSRVRRQHRLFYDTIETVTDN